MIELTTAIFADGILEHVPRGNRSTVRARILDNLYALRENYMKNDTGSDQEGEEDMEEEDHA